MTPLLQAILTAVAPMVITQIAKGSIKRIPRSWLPWISCALGAAATQVPGWDAISPQLGAALGLSGVGLYEGTLDKMFRVKAPPAPPA